MSGPALPLLPHSDSEPRTGFGTGSVWRHSAASTGSATAIAQIIQGLGGEDALRQSLGDHAVRELHSLSRESTPEIFWSELNQLAGRWSQQNHDDQALTLYGFLTHSIPEQFSEIRNTAVARQNALLGVGDTGSRLEVLARRFSREATDPVMLLSMGGAQAVFGITRLGILSRLGASRSFLTPLLNSRRIAFAGAFAAEGIGFVGIHRGLDAAMGRNRGADAGFLHELAGTYLTLGGLRLAGALGTSGFNRLHEVNALTGKIGRFEGLAGWTRPLLQQGATLGGIYLGHSAETWAGLRRPTDGATTFVDSLSTLAQFAVAGRLMHVGLPGIERMTRNLELRSEIASQPRLDSSWLRPEQVHSVLSNVFGTPLLPATEGGGKIHELVHLPMAMSTISEGKGFGGGPSGTGETSGSGESNGSKTAEGDRAPDSLPPPSISPPVPPASPSSNPPPSGVRRSKSPGVLVRGLNAFNWTASKLNLNAFMSSRAPLHSVPSREPAPPVLSVREGMQRAEALGHNRRTLAAIRLGASRLKNLPESQQRFLDLTLGILDFQRRHGELLDPVLRSLPHPDFAPLNNLAKNYREAVTGLTPGSGYYFGQARLLLERVAEWTTVEQYQNLSAAELRAVGIEPDATKAIERNGHAFSEWDICQILNHPLLRELPASETLRTAARDYQSTLEGILRSIQDSKPEIESIKQQMASTESVEERQALETRKADIAKRVNNSYGRAMLTFNRAMKNFMADPVRARIFLVRTTERSTLIRGLQDWNVAK